MKQVIKLKENEFKKLLKKYIKESINNNVYMSDEDIDNQYSNSKIKSIKVDPSYNGKERWWHGSIDIEFPNADDIDYDSSKYDEWISYDDNGNKIAFDSWYPENVYNYLSNSIRKKISEFKANKISENKIRNTIRKLIKK